jgi:hypothetical protein
LIQRRSFDEKEKKVETLTGSQLFELQKQPTGYDLTWAEDASNKGIRIVFG